MMDPQTLERLADFICGDGGSYPTYRSGSELTRFFHRVGFSNFTHDGTTRKWWTLNVLQQLTSNNLNAVIIRLANPREYGGNQEQVRKAITGLNQILMIEGLKVALSGIDPKIVRVTPQFAEEEPELKPLPPPDFLHLKMEAGLGDILKNRWSEIQLCFDAKAYLAATILMGSFLEGMLLSVMQSLPKEANTALAAPKSDTGKVKYFAEWSLSDMINVAHECGWIGLDVHRFSHALRSFRNLIHPYEQMVSRSLPDKDTSDISWLVVQAAANDLARKLQ
ncbi:MAG: hypothetical protein M1461_01020 [Nitrospirae bacterium]|nr:hypothetical protein [Nitrospirota bacterium]